MTVEPAGRLYKALVETKKATGGRARGIVALHDPGFIIFCAQVPPADSLDAARDALHRDARGRRKAQPITARRSRSRARARRCKQFDETLNDPQQLGVALVGVDRARRLAPVLPAARPLAHASRAADVQRVAPQYLKPAEPHGRRSSSPTRSPTARRRRRRRTSPRMVKDYKGDPRVAAGEVVRPHAGQPRGAHAALHAAQRHEGRAAAEEDARRDGASSQLRLHYGDEKSLLGMSPRGALAASMLPRGTQEARPAGVRGHARPAAREACHSAAARRTRRRGAKPFASSCRNVCGSRRGAARAGVPASGVREAEARAADALEERSAPIPQNDRASAPLAAGTIRIPTATPLHADVRRGDRGDRKRRSSSSCARLPHAFTGGANAELAIVGDFDAAPRCKALVDRALRRVDEPAPYARVPESVSSRRRRRVLPRADARQGERGAVRRPVVVRSTTRAATSGADRRRQDLARRRRDSRISERVREKEGLSYGISRRGSVRRASRKTRTLNLYAIFAPQNRERLRTAISEELARALKDGFTEAELADAKRALLQARRIARAQDASLAGGLVQQAYLGRTWDYARRSTRASQPSPSTA